LTKEPISEGFADNVNVGGRVEVASDRRSRTTTLSNYADELPAPAAISPSLSLIAWTPCLPEPKTYPPETWRMM